MPPGDAAWVEDGVSLHAHHFPNILSAVFGVWNQMSDMTARTECIRE